MAMEIYYVSENKYYVYIHYIIDELGNKNIFYVGKGKGDRIYSQKRNSTWQRIVKANNSKYHCKVLEYFENEIDALEYEDKIKLFYWDKGQCRGCRDVHIITTRERKKNFSIPVELLDKWLSKTQIEELLIKKHFLKDGKGRFLSVNKFREFVLPFGFEIVSRRKRKKGMQGTFHRIQKLNNE